MHLALVAADLAAVCILVFALYLPRHHRRDLVVAFVGVNIGVMAVTGALIHSTVGAGLGLGLFGVLSIIRLRSTELGQREVAYYFSALALGLLGGLETATPWMSVGLMAMIIVAIYLGDHPAIVRGAGSMVVILDSAVLDEAAVVARLEAMLGASVQGVSVQRVDLVNDTTWVEVRTTAAPRAPGPRSRARKLDRLVGLRR